MCVLANLEYLSILFCAVFWAAAPGLVAVLLSICVWYCYVPGHWLSSGPWQDSGPIWAFVVIPHQVDWLLLLLSYSPTSFVLLIEFVAVLGLCRVCRLGLCLYLL